jgi:hypothetical protein
MNTNPAAAGSLLIGTVVFCAGLGLGIGALIGAAAPLAVAGAFVGFGLGMWLVYRRFRDL